jgi:chromosome segregation ATPase
VDLVNYWQLNQDIGVWSNEQQVLAQQVAGLRKDLEEKKQMLRAERQRIRDLVDQVGEAEQRRKQLEEAVFGCEKSTHDSENQCNTVQVKLDNMKGVLEGWQDGAVVWQKQIMLNNKEIQEEGATNLMLESQSQAVKERANRLRALYDTELLPKLEKLKKNKKKK